MTNHQENGSLLSVDWQDTYQSFQEFRRFWEECKNIITNDDVQKKQLDSQLTEFRNQTVHARSIVTGLQEFLQQIPIVIAIAHWVRELFIDPIWGSRYLDKMLQLQQRGVIPFTDGKGHAVKLDYYTQFGHQGILEDIRCVKAWSLIEVEEFVQCYIQFSRSLARQTLNFIPAGFDPDRERVQHKIVKYELFIDFMQHLSERDALIAKLLYFGAPSLEEVLSLGRNAINPANSSVIFPEGPVFFPKHMIQDLHRYVVGRPENQQLVFANVRGAEVERAHLNQSFSRACEKMSTRAKITPGNLLKLTSGMENAAFPGNRS